MIPQDIKDKLKRVPETFGVYLMKNGKGQVIYVGKAKNLKSRLSSYFLRSDIEDPKTRVLVKEIKDFEVILLTNEVEALLLERTLIKEHKPNFNIILRDDKEYPYLRIDMQSLWPRIKKVRRRKNDGAVYLGPYSHVSYLNSILELTYRIFPLIRCNEYTFKTVKRPCNYYHIKRCLGPCTLPVDNAAYKDMMQSAIDFLQGKDKTVQQKLKQNMSQAAQDENYEAAARYRDQLEALKVITQNQNVVIKKIKDCDAIGFTQDQEQISFHILKIREGSITGRDNFIIPMRLSDLEKALSDFILQYYEKQYIPPEIYIPLVTPSDLSAVALAQAEVEGAPTELSLKNIEEFLRTTSDNKHVQISHPQRGQKKSLVDLSTTNSRYHLEEMLTKHARDTGLLLHLQKCLRLNKVPFRIDCFDISNIQGTAIVASEVCFIGGKPAKDRYRLYNIEDQRDKPDDYWALRHVMHRCFQKWKDSGDPPDLILIDGGKGQLSSVVSVANEYPEVKCEIRSIAKNRVTYESDSHAERSEERIYFPEEEHPFVLKEGSAEFQILTQLRDEAHRFAITQHRKRRKKVSERSLLDNIKGLGPEMKKRLLPLMIDRERLLNMRVEDLIRLTRIPKTLAERVLLTLRNFEKSDGEK